MEEKKKGYQPFQHDAAETAGKREESDERSRVPRDYVRQNFDRDDRLAVVTIERRNGGKAGMVQQRIMTAAQLASEEVQRNLRVQNANNRDIYVSMNTMRDGAQGRTKADVDQIRHIYLDVDVGGKEALDEILKADGVPNPHHVLETSPGKHQIVWQVEGFDKDQAERMLRNMAAAHGADPAVTDCSRVLRLPGFRNCKYDKEQHGHWVRDTQESPAQRPYRPEDFPHYPEVEIKPPSPGPRRGFSENGGQSQSERDWAFAMRQLQKGVNPEVVKRNIELYRQDKPNPGYYADRTVERARMVLASRGGPNSGDSESREANIER